VQPNSSRRSFPGIAAVIFLALCIWWLSKLTPTVNWTTDEIKILQSLSLSSLPPLPTDLSNTVSDNLKAAEFGRQLFFDERLSYNSKISCATCHAPEKQFTDGLTTSAGAQAGLRNAPTLVGVAYSPWQFWDGRSDSQWSQALAPLENNLEHAASRTQFAHIVFEDKSYRTRYEELFGAIPDLSNKQRFPEIAGPVEDNQSNDAWHTMVVADQHIISNIFVNIAKSIAAYERLLLPDASRFDYYVEGVVSNDEQKKEQLDKEEIFGLKLFIGKAQCINCHNGPLLTNHEFHNTGILSAPRQLPSLGRANGVRLAQDDPFNCIGEFSDADSEQCAELRFAKSGDELIGAHKTPTLRNISETAPYMHAGQLSTLEEVIEHYDQAPLAMIGHNEIKPLNLNGNEKKALLVFLQSLNGPLAIEAKWLKNPYI